MDRDYAQTRTHVLEVLEHSGVFPKNVDISVREGSGSAIVAVISWRLGNDAARPNKRSTEISLVIDGRVTNLFLSASEDRLPKLDDALRKVMRNRLHDYREDYDLPKGKASPAFKIHIGIEDLD